MDQAGAVVELRRGAPPLRWRTRRLEVIRRPLPCNVSALLPRRISGLVRLYLLQHGRQPLVVDDRAGLHGLDLVEHLETERCSVELNREPAVRVIHHFHLLARQATGQRCSGPAAASSGHSAGSGCASPCAPPARPGSRPDHRLASAADAGPLFKPGAGSWHSPGRGRNACCRR